LEAQVKKGRFRPDLYYRLNVFPIIIPPLRERPQDIALLANYFIKRHCLKLEIAEKEIASDTLALLQSYSWPGNIRQLENVLERAALLAKGAVILPRDLPELAESDEIASPPGDFSVQPTPELETIEKAYIYYVLSQNEWQKAKAAKILGIDASTLYRKIERYGMKIPD